MAADQGRRPGVPGVLPGAVRRPPGLRSARGWSPARHRRYRLRGQPLVDHLLAARAGGRRVGQPARRGRQPPDDPKVAWHAVDLLDRAAVRDAIAALRPSVVYHCAGAADVGDVVGRSGDAAAGQRARHASPARGRAARRLDDCPWSWPARRLVYRASTDADRRGLADRPVEPLRRQQARAGDARGARDVVPVVLARPFNHAGPRQSPAYVTSSFARQIAEIEAGVAEPPCCASATSTRGATSPTCATPCAPTGCSRRADSRGRPYNICCGRAYRIGDLLEMLLARARVPIDVESTRRGCGPTTTRSSLGDPSRIATEIGWQPTIPIEADAERPARTTGAPRRRRSCVMAARQHDERGRKVAAHRDGRLRAAAAWLPGGRRRCSPARALVFNVLVLPRIGRAPLSPGERARQRPSGIVLYPLAVLLLLLVFPAPARHRRRGVGHSRGRRRHGDARRRAHPARRHAVEPREVARRQRSRSFLFGGIAGAFARWWCRPSDDTAASLWFSLAAPVAAALVAALVETIPIRLDDNLSVPGRGAPVAVGVVAGSRGPRAPRRSRAARSAAACRARASTSPSRGRLSRAHRDRRRRGRRRAHRHRRSAVHAGLGGLGAAARDVPRGRRSARGSGCGARRCSGSPKSAADGAAPATRSRTPASPPSRRCCRRSTGATGDRRSLAFVAALAAGGSDTVASEIGKAWGRRT